MLSLSLISLALAREYLILHTRLYRMHLLVLLITEQDIQQQVETQHEEDIGDILYYLLEASLNYYRR